MLENVFEGLNALSEVNLSKVYFAKCTRLAFLLSFASLLKSKRFKDIKYNTHSDIKQWPLAVALYKSPLIQWSIGP